MEIKEAAKVARFGSVVPISGSDFVREVSQAPADVWVVVLLYKDGYVVIQRLTFLFISSYLLFFELVWCLEIYGCLYLITE